VCDGKNGRRRHNETHWWTDRIREAVRRKNNAWKEWFSDRTDNKKKMEMEKTR
jgi:hypothetical protein